MSECLKFETLRIVVRFMLKMVVQVRNLVIRQTQEFYVFDKLLNFEPLPNYRFCFYFTKTTIFDEGEKLYCKTVELNCTKVVQNNLFPSQFTSKLSPERKVIIERLSAIPYCRFAIYHSRAQFLIKSEITNQLNTQSKRKLLNIKNFHHHPPCCSLPWKFF